MNPNEVRVIFIHRPDTNIESVRQQFLAELGNPACETVRPFPTKTHFIIQTDRDPKELSESIQFGRVANVNQLARIVMVVPQLRRPD